MLPNAAGPLLNLNLAVLSRDLNLAVRLINLYSGLPARVYSIFSESPHTMDLAPQLLTLAQILKFDVHPPDDVKK